METKTSKFIKDYDFPRSLPWDAVDVYDMAKRWFGDETTESVKKAAIRLAEEEWEFIGYGEFAEMYVPAGWTPK